MRPVAEIQRVNDRLLLWQGYDASVKTDLYSHALLTDGGWLLVDPIPLEDSLLAEFSSKTTVGAIVVTSSNHERAAADFKKITGATVFAHASAKPDMSLEADHWVDEGDLVSGCEVIHLPGFASGEIALYSKERSGVMLMGDALINVEPYGFSVLPPKYCSAPKLAGKSLQKLLQFSFEVMTFAHGIPITSGAANRLEQLLR